MTKKVLHGKKICSLVQKMSSKGMSQGVRAGLLVLRYPGSIFFDYPPDTSNRKSSARSISGKSPPHLW